MKSFLLAIAAWIIHIYAQDVTEDFWYALSYDSHLFVAWQQYSIFTLGYDFNLHKKVDTRPVEVKHDPN